jgi:hypothetical protein
MFRGLPQFLEARAGVVPSVKPIPLHILASSLSAIIKPFHVRPGWSELLTPPLNKLQWNVEQKVIFQRDDPTVHISDSYSLSGSGSEQKNTIFTSA